MKHIAQAALQNQSFRRTSGSGERRVVKSSILGLPARIDLPDTSDEEEEDGPRYVPSTVHESLWPVSTQVPKGSPNSFNLHGDGRGRRASQSEYGTGSEQGYPPYHRKSEPSHPPPSERATREEAHAPKRSMADLIPAGPMPYNIQAAEDLLIQMAQQMATKRMRFDDHMMAGMMPHGYPEGVMSPELMQHLMLQQFHHPSMATWNEANQASRVESRDPPAGPQSSESSNTDAVHR